MEIVNRRLLIVDSDIYSSVLYNQITKRGWNVESVRLEDSLKSMNDIHVDAVILEVLSSKWGKGLDPDIGINICKQMIELNSEQPIELMVYSDMPRTEFFERCKLLSMDIEKCTFYSKSEMEVPPPLECIKDRIVQNPRLIGIEIELLVPASITRDWIQQERSVYCYLCEYVVRHMREHHDDENPLETLPVGLRMVWAICRCESEIFNGGFEQYLANATSNSIEVEDVKSAIEASSRMGLAELQTVIEKAAEIWNRFMEQHPEMFNSCMATDDVENTQLEETGDVLENEVWPALEILDEDFMNLESAWVGAIGAYIKNNPEEFVHEIN